MKPLKTTQIEKFLSSSLRAISLLFKRKAAGGQPKTKRPKTNANAEERIVLEAACTAAIVAGISQ